MIKKILPISIFILVCIFILLVGLQNMIQKKKSQESLSLSPTGIRGKQIGNTINSIKQLTSREVKNKLPISSTHFTIDYSERAKQYVVTLKTEDGQEAYSQWLDENQSYVNELQDVRIETLSVEDLKQKLPLFTPDFSINYSSRMQRYVVTLKTENGETAYSQWLDQNPTFAAFLTPEEVIVAHQTMEELHSALDYAEENKLSPEQAFKKDTDSLLTIINTLFSPISIPEDSISPIPSVAPTAVPTEVPAVEPVVVPTEKPSQGIIPPSSFGNTQYTYYAQCGGQYDNYPLPNGCTVCKAGCGPTTAAMILSSYVDSTLTPPKVIELMKKKGIPIGCDGAEVYSLHGFMSKISGITVSSIIPYKHIKSNAQAKDVVSDFRNYIQGGWTILALTSHKFGGHYFWVTNVTSDGQILAYDPAYGSGRPTPFNENQYNPFPYYLYAFAVKKN